MARLPAAPFTLSFRLDKRDTGKRSSSMGDSEDEKAISKFRITRTMELQPNGATIWAVFTGETLLFRVEYYPHDKSARLVLRWDDSKNKSTKIKLIRSLAKSGQPKGHYMFRSESGLSFVRLIRTEESEFDFDD